MGYYYFCGDRYWVENNCILTNFGWFKKNMLLRREIEWISDRE